jgi:Sec-independent protein translocase protein TatA
MDRIVLILIVVLIIVIIWRGPRTLPLIGRAFGQGVKEARKEISEIKSDVTKKSDDAAGGPPAPPAPSAPPAPPAPGGTTSGQSGQSGPPPA